MSKKITVISKALEGKDLNRIRLDEAMKAYAVPAGLVDIASVLVPDLIGLGEFSLDVPKFDKKGNSLQMSLHKKKDGEEYFILKVVVSFDDKKPHELKMSTDGGKTWKEVSYKSDAKEDTVAAEA